MVNHTPVEMLKKGQPMVDTQRTESLSPLVGVRVSVRKGLDLSPHVQKSRK